MLFFCQNYVLYSGGSFWQKDNLFTFTLFELCLLWYLAQSQILVTSLCVSTYKNVLEKLVTYKKRGISIQKWYK